MKKEKQKSDGQGVAQNEEKMDVAEEKKNDTKIKKQGFEGIKISEKKKVRRDFLNKQINVSLFLFQKKKVNKGLLQKKLLVKKLLPKPRE